ncbi:MAG: pullulanase-type alpha-1,6-glucosidase, partial [Candidatus Krumholzibacteriia bacterium]
PELLKGQLAVSVTDADERLENATGVQIPGVLDELFAYEGPLGVAWEDDVPTLRLWAPTARSVRLLLFDGSGSRSAHSVLDMTERDGVWALRGRSDWNLDYYLYEVEVYVPSTGKIERNRVTDPASLSLSTNSRRSQIVDLDDAAMKPEGWDALAKPRLEDPVDIVLYELHVRDFSANDTTVPPPYRGTYMAFTVDSDGTRHLRALAEAGLTHVHLLPVFDVASINEDRTTWKHPGDLSVFPPDSEEPQSIVSGLLDHDPYNWGYDPFHYGVPEGSYSTSPDGVPHDLLRVGMKYRGRIVEFRSMVQALAGMGLRVIMDVVYNHTHASGLGDKSVLDKIVPGYYHRLNRDGFVETSTCCQNTATEHFMMERLMIDDLVHWAVDYKVDGFRFDLMGHHMKRNMEKARDALWALTLEADGVDGSKIYLYGEGWDFGEVARNARGPNASQHNMAGTGIGTFNDRMRDAVRGGNPFGDRREQGFVTGLFTEPNGFHQGGERDRHQLLQHMDRIRAGLAGNLAGYRFVSCSGREVRGGDLDYAGYTAQPQETINYVSAHDNETLFDKIQFTASPAAGLEARLRMQNLGMSLVALAQGVPFFHAGVDMLRSKSLDADSYNSGDWFNRLDFSYASNNFGVGLPPATKNRERWDLMRRLLGRPDIVPGQAEIGRAVSHFREMLRIRKSSPLFRLRTAEDIQSCVRFHNTGPEQIPGLIVMSLTDAAGVADLDPELECIVVLFNAHREGLCFEDHTLAPLAFELHPVQQASADPVVRTSRFDLPTRTFCIPARTTAVFVAR